MDPQAGNLKIIFGDCTLGMKGRSFHYIFSYGKGAFESLKKDGREWFYRPPMPTFWRAETDNDRGSGFSTRSAMWVGADLFRSCVDRKVFVNDELIAFPGAPENNRYSNHEYAGSAAIEFTYETCTVPKTIVRVRWRVASDGAITVNFHYFGKTGLPQFPVVGLRFIMPTPAVGYTYRGLSGETYPDRKAGGVPGTYEVRGLPVTPYLVPQDCGMHVDTEWVEVTRNRTLNINDRSFDDFSLRFESDGEPFAFSCLPYTAEELENALHREELPTARRTILSVLAGVRGVGGIDSWGADVEEQYHLNAEKDYELTFRIL